MRSFQPHQPGDERPACALVASEAWFGGIDRGDQPPTRSVFAVGCAKCS